MPSIKVLDTGRLDERDSAFPQAIQLPDGDIVCSYGVGGGPFVHGGTDWSRSSDGGRSWRREGEILPATANPLTSNYLKLSLSPNERTVYAYGLRFQGPPEGQFGTRAGEAVLCTSDDGCRTWSPAQVIPMAERRLEISHAICALRSGRLLAPAATLEDPEALGEEVFVVVSDDQGRSWPTRRTVFRDPRRQFGYWEQKLAEISPGLIMAVAWTVSLGDYRDQPNHFALSRDQGLSWSAPQSTGIMGQTMTPIPWHENRLLVLYNRRFGEQAIVACLVSFDDSSWTVHHESVTYDAGAYHERRLVDGHTGVDELDSFQFGFPTAIRLEDGTVLATHWCVERGICGIRWTKMQIDW